MPECSRLLSWQKLPSPRTCAICGLGPCRGGPNGRPWEPFDYDAMSSTKLLQVAEPVSAGQPDSVGPEPQPPPDVVQASAAGEIADVAAGALWDILDRIQDADEMLRDGPKDDAAFRLMVRALLEQRWAVAFIDQHENPAVLKWKAPPED